MNPPREAPPASVAALTTGATGAVPLVRLSGVALRLGEGGALEALRDLELAVLPGEHVAVVGASGAGKTSLLRLLSGELAATRGDVSVKGRTASIYQDFRLVGTATALQNALHGAAAEMGTLRSLCAVPESVRERAERWLERLGLAARRDTRVDRLSGGEQQRVALARALMREPAILLADEPVSALDPASARALMTLLDELRRAYGLTVISVMHDVELAREFADRVLFLEQGRLLAEPPHAPSPSATALSPPAPPPPAAKVVALRSDASAAAPASWAGLAPGPDAPDFARATGTAAGSAWKAWAWRAATTAGVALLCAWAVSALELRWPESGVAENLGRFAGALVPSATQLGAMDWPALGASLLDTLLMAWLGTLLAVLVALPLSAIAARNVAPAWLRMPVRGLLNAIRAVPSLLWALLAVGAFGLGALPGVIALAAYSLGYLTKFFYEAFESVEPRLPEALAALGLGRTQRFFAAVAPQSRMALLSSGVFMLEYNFRTATVLGIVGAGGIGYELKMAVDWGNWHVVGVILVVLIAAVTAFDALSARLRRALA